MANDNLLAALTGLAEGIAAVSVPFGKKKYDTQLELELARAKQPMEIDTYKQEQAIKGQQDVATKKAEYPIENPSVESLGAIPPALKGLDKYSVGDAVKVAGLGKKDAGREEASQKQQDKLEEDYRKLHVKVLSNRSGGLGMQDAKVNQAIHLRSLLDQYYDPKNDTYNVPKSQYEELAIGLATLISGGTAPTESMISGIRQRTAKGDFNGAIAYITGGTPSGSTTAIFKNLADSIDRQGSISEDLRKKYHEDLKTKSPTRLDPERKKSGRAAGNRVKLQGLSCKISIQIKGRYSSVIRSRRRKFTGKSFGNWRGRLR